MTYRRYKTLTIVLLVITVIAMLLTAVTFTLGRRTSAVSAEPNSPPENTVTTYYTPKPATSQENSETEESGAGTGFLVTIYRGGIGVFQDGRTLPVLTKHTQVYLLPEEDIKLLREGIRARDLTEAREILEDFD